MRNGLNTGNMSELVHEIRTNPEEAQFRYGVDSTCQHRELISCATRTLQGGTIRIARPFTIEATALGCSLAATPEQLLLLALGGCAMITFLLGCGAKGVSLNSLRMELRAEYQRDQGLENVAYRLLVDCDAEPDVVGAIAHHVACFSPNHRTFIDRNQIEVTIADDRVSDRHRSATEPSANRVTFLNSTEVVGLQAAIDWQFGTQLSGYVWQSNSEARHAYAIDQPKQALGLDRAPNPQEYLLAALATDLHRGAQSRGGDSASLGMVPSFSLSGKLDLRGLLNVDSSVPTRFHELRVNLKDDGHLDVSQAEGTAIQLVGDSSIAQTICNPTPITVSVIHNGVEVEHFVSDQNHVHTHLSHLAQKCA
jgi:uncharacterized OsmC-like protein